MRIAEGGFSFVYLGTDLQNGSREVALKLYHFKDKNELKFPIHEARVLADINGIVLDDINGNVLDDINGNKGIPTIYWSGDECEYHVIAQELLGPTLYALLDQFRVFSFKTTLLIADQAIERLEFIHSKGYLHGDIKPANMAMGQGEHGNLLYFLDFGSARKFGHDEEWKSRHGKGFFSTDLYASPNIIDGKGCLPRRCKLQRPSVRKMCKGLPKEFFEYFRHIRSLEHGQKPDYDHLRELFCCASRNRGYQYDNIYDWTSKWFNEVHGIKSTPKKQSELVEKQITISLTPHELASAGGSIEMQL
ncbi:casein kinase 1 epsilon [Beauveria bassiana ARSEF 2860]|uniref:Casein kinase 1 epsilon n=1 Tax=Beauveria bassiana (strain ARSEF 2860) TaxID=655819 RepID=J4W2B4_BEAB2|nr:casein kinase 1 epsilon [Beauveria bassiana ARSEF 2860]EJP64610.1 casein kinase 1 epsilon [Beauveria bassiana ARSEF 2860]